MRALILVLAAVVVGLSVSILVHKPPSGTDGPVLRAALFIANAAEGEEAVYMDGEGNRLTYRVERNVPGGPDHPPSIRVRREVKDVTGRLIATATYDHLPTAHFLFPLVAPEDPDGYDRVWVWQRLRRDDVDWKGKPRSAWRFDCIDPALGPDEDSVVAWMDENVPVFGLLRWQRGGRTWTWLESGT